MSDKNKIYDNQIEFNDVHSGFYETKHKENNKTNEEIIDESKNDIDYKEKLKEMDELKEKVSELTNQFANFYKVFEECILNDNNGRWKSLYENMKNEKRSNYTFNVDNVEGLVNEKINNCYSKSEPDLAIQSQDGKTLVGEVKVKQKVTQKELPLFDKKSGTGAFLGSIAGALMGGLPGAMLGNSFMKSISNSNNEKETINLKYLIDNPVKNFEEFAYRLVKIDPTVTEELLQRIKELNRVNDLDLYNDILIQTFQYGKDLAEIKAMKSINDSEIDYSNYKCKNLLGEYMEKNGKKVAWLSKKTGVPRSTLESICRNPSLMPTVDKALKICKSLGEDLEKIFPLQEQ